MCVKLQLKLSEQQAERQGRNPRPTVAAEVQMGIKTLFIPKGRDWKHSQPSVGQGGLQLFMLLWKFYETQ